jgi:hypothetical protein
VPWLLLVSGCMLRACEVVFGKAPVFVKKNKAIL